MALNNFITITLLSAILFVSNPLLSQQSSVFIHENAEFKKAIELFQKEKYGAAQKSFNAVIESTTNVNSLERIDAEYFSAICAIELFNKDGALYLKQFINAHLESPRVKTAYFHLGRYNYRKKKYIEVIDWFSKVDIYDLTIDELAEFYFKRGYSYFNTKQYDLAKQDLHEIKDVPNKYTAPATYYYGHISYLDKHYETALNNLIKIRKDETFGAVVSFYIVQLYYLQQQYDSVIAYAPKLLDTINTKRAPEISRLIGESYFHTKQYKKSIPYYIKYEDSFGVLPREDNYQLGYVYYKTNDLANAIYYFKKVTAEGNSDSLSQNVTYHLADCYLQLKNKQKALNAFGKTAQLGFNKNIQEDALFNYAKLSYELSYNPYNEAINAFRKYIKNYPNSQRIDEAYTYLVNAFITTKNYRLALKSLDNIKDKTPELKSAYQKIAYYQGVYLFNNGEYTAAISHFDRSNRYNFDKTIHASAIYWKGEAYYRLKDFGAATQAYKQYIAAPGRIEKSELGEANYNIAYAYFRLNNYEKSNLWFRKFVTFKPSADPKKVNDAYNRIGDGYFMKRVYRSAATYYELAYNQQLIDGDYSLMQLALVNGVQKKSSEKIEHLQSFIEKFPKSFYMEKVKFELAQTLMYNKQPDSALTNYKSFIVNYPNSEYLNICLNKMGLIYNNKNETDSALAYFDQLIKRDRKSLEANEAIEVVKNIYKDKGEIEELANYMSSIGAALPQATLDTLTFDIGKAQYLDQNCDRAIKDLEKYIIKFADGIFITNAHFYKAQCEFHSDNISAALADYKFVIKSNKNKNTEIALYQVSTILYAQAKYKEASNYFIQLETASQSQENTTTAIIGLMRSYYQTQEFAATINYAEKVLALDKISEELTAEAHYKIAKSLFTIGQYDNAAVQFNKVANTVNNETAAESAYFVSYIKHLNCDYKSAEASIFTFIHSDANSPFWITKALILLADNYLAQEDSFQAKAILNSIITDSDIPELISIATVKVDKIKNDEEAARAALIQVPDTIELMFEGDSLEMQELFLEPVIIE